MERYGVYDLGLLMTRLNMEKQGVAQLLTTGVEDFAREKGYELMWLGVWERERLRL
jgi:predicted N-acetyltransferase YhbS